MLSKTQNRATQWVKGSDENSALFFFRIGPDRKVDHEMMARLTAKRSEFWRRCS